MQLLVGIACVVCTPLGLYIKRKVPPSPTWLTLPRPSHLLRPSHHLQESHLHHPPHLPCPPNLASSHHRLRGLSTPPLCQEALLLLALLLAGGGLVLLTSFLGSKSSTHLHISSLLLGAAFGSTNAYATTLWEYLYGDADVHRIRQTSIAITTAFSGFAIFVFSLSREYLGSYKRAVMVSSCLSFSLAGVDLLLLAKPEVIEAVVRRAPVWEQLLAWRQRMAYTSSASKLMGCVHAAQRCVGMQPQGATPPNQANPIELAAPP